jgi:hypothetical protein
MIIAIFVSSSVPLFRNESKPNQTDNVTEIFHLKKTAAAAAPEGNSIVSTRWTNQRTEQEARSTNRRRDNGGKRKNEFLFLEFAAGKRFQ